MPSPSPALAESVPAASRHRPRSRRRGAPPGEAHGHSKLTDDRVRAARLLFVEGIPISAIARAFGISRQALTNAVHRRTWGHVGERG